MDERVKFLTEVNSLVVVVEENHVESFSSRGFRLLEIVFTDLLEEVEEKMMEQENGNSYGSKSRTGTKSVVVRRPRFVMVQNGNGALADKQADLDESLRQVHELRKDRDNFEIKAADLENKMKGLEADKRRLASTIEDKLKEITAERTSKRKIEEDIGKIRTAIGDLKMKEIIGG